MKRGYTDWDKALLSPRQLEMRREKLAAVLREQGLDAAVIYGDVNAADELVELTNYAPYWCNTAAIVTADGRYRLVTGHNARVNPWICRITGVDEEQITPAGMKVPGKTAQVLAELFPDGARIGLIGKYTLADAAKALQDKGFQLSLLPGVLDSVLDRRDEAYLAIVRKGHALMEAALQQTLDTVPATQNIKLFCAELEYALRRAGAMDVVLLAAVEGEAFSLPYPQAADRWNLFINVQYLGQWLVFAMPIGGGDAVCVALEHAAGRLRPGEAPAAKEEGCRITVKTRVLSDHISSLNRPGSAVEVGQVFSMSAFDPATGVYAERMYQMGEKGAEPLGRF